MGLGNMSESLNYFKELNLKIDNRAEEITYWNGAVEEHLFDAKKISRDLVIRFVDAIGGIFGEGVDLSRLQQFSFQLADGINYKNDKFMAVYSGGSKRALEHEIDVFEAHDDYCVNFNVGTLQTTFKFYDLDIEKYSIPALPDGSEIVTSFGLGIRTDSQVRDVYFSHSNLDEVSLFFDMPNLRVKDLDLVYISEKATKVFGLSFDSVSLRPLRLKRYLYPQDLEVRKILYDEVI